MPVSSIENVGNAERLGGGRAGNRTRASVQSRFSIAIYWDSVKESRSIAPFLNAVSI